MNRRPGRGPQDWQGSAAGAAAAMVLCALWEAAAQTAAQPALPPPSAILALAAGPSATELSAHSLASLVRVSAALALALACALPGGLLLGLRPRIDRLAMPFVRLLFPVPKIAFLPLFFLAFGLSDGARIGLIALIVYFPLLVAVRDAARAIPPELFLAARSLAPGRRRWLARIILPAVLPATLGALRLAVGIACSVLFVAENFAADYGLGSLIMNSWGALRYDLLWAGMLALALLGALLFGLFELLERLLCPWLPRRLPSAGAS